MKGRETSRQQRGVNGSEVKEITGWGGGHRSQVNTGHYEDFSHHCGKQRRCSVFMC